MTVENTIFSRMECGINFAYILKDNSRFLTTEYKVLQSQQRGCFLKSKKMLYNGKTELFYMTEGYKTFSSLGSVLDVDGFLAVTGNLLDSVAEVKDNGFLSCCNLDISCEKIYVDTATYKVRLAYLPINPHLFQDDAEFESELRVELIKLIDSRTDKNIPALMRLSSDLADGTLTLEEVGIRMRGGTISREPEPVPVPASAAQSMYLVTMSAPRIELRVTKDEFIIGKKVSEVDGAVTFNRMISRVHCKVTRRGSEYTVTDLKSANGTFINRNRLIPEQAYPIRNGDVVRLANTDFQVIIR